MGPDDGDISFPWGRVVKRNVLLHSQPELILMPGFDGTRPLPHILAADGMFNGAEVGYTSYGKEARSIG